MLVVFGWRPVRRAGVVQKVGLRGWNSSGLGLGSDQVPTQLSGLDQGLGDRLEPLGQPAVTVRIHLKVARISIDDDTAIEGIDGVRPEVECSDGHGPKRSKRHARYLSKLST